MGWVESAHFGVGKAVVEEFKNALLNERVDPYLLWRLLIGIQGPDDGSGGINLVDGKFPIVAELKGGVDANKFIWTKDHPNHDTSLLSKVYAEKLPKTGVPSRYIATRVHVLHLLELLKSLKKGDVLRFQLGLPRGDGLSTNLAPMWTVPSSSEALHFVGVIDDGLPFMHPDINPNGADVYFVWDQNGVETVEGSGPIPGTAPVNMAYGREFVGLPSRGASSNQASPKKSLFAKLTASAQSILGFPPTQANAPQVIANQSLIASVIQSSKLTDPAGYDQHAYKLLRYSIDGPARKHGVGVLHAAVGKGVRNPHISGGTAVVVPTKKFPLIAVQFPSTAARDTSGGWLGFHVLDGVRYIIDRASAVAKRAVPASGKWDVVINVSFGGNAGPHDGTSVVECAMDELCDEYSANVAIVLAAGNTHARRMHAHRSVTGGPVPGRFFVAVPPDKTSDTYVEIWIPESLAGVLDKLSLTVFSPDHATRPPLKVGSSAMWREGVNNTNVGDTTAALIFCKKVAQGDNGTMALLAIRPTAASRTRSRALAGLWRVEVNLDEGVAGTHEFHAWIERDDRLTGVRRTQQAKFVDDGTGSVVSVPDAPTSPEQIDTFTMNGIAHGKQTFVAGGLYAQSRISAAPPYAHAFVPRYSSAGPGVIVNGSTRRGPDFSAITDTSKSSVGLILSGALAGRSTRMSGTSIAAPRVSNYLATQLAGGKTIATVRADIAKLVAPTDPRIGKVWLP